MILKQVKFQSESNDFETVWVISSEQYQMLLNYAINKLMQEGIVRVMEMEASEFIQTGSEEEKQEYAKYLESLDKNKIPQA